jgi:hypothetical protein
LLAVTFVREGEWRFFFAHSCPELDSASAAALLAQAFAPRSNSAIPSYERAACGAA